MDLPEKLKKKKKEQKFTTFLKELHSQRNNESLWL